MQSLALPEESVLFFDGRNCVFVKRNNNFVLVPVEIGEKEGKWVEIKNGASLEKETIVIQSAYTLLMELKNKAD